MTAGSGNRNSTPHRASSGFRGLKRAPAIVLYGVFFGFIVALNAPGSASAKGDWLDRLKFQNIGNDPDFENVGSFIASLYYSECMRRDVFGACDALLSASGEVGPISDVVRANAHRKRAAIKEFRRDPCGALSDYRQAYLLHAFSGLDRKISSLAAGAAMLCPGQSDNDVLALVPQVEPPKVEAQHATGVAAADTPESRPRTDLAHLPPRDVPDACRPHVADKTTPPATSECSSIETGALPDFSGSLKTAEGRPFSSGGLHAKLIILTLLLSAWLASLLLNENLAKLQRLFFPVRQRGSPPDVRPRRDFIELRAEAPRFSIEPAASFETLRNDPPEDIVKPQEQVAEASAPQAELIPAETQQSLAPDQADPADFEIGHVAVAPEAEPILAESQESPSADQADPAEFEIEHVAVAPEAEPILAESQQSPSADQAVPADIEIEHVAVAPEAEPILAESQQAPAADPAEVEIERVAFVPQAKPDASGLDERSTAEPIRMLAGSTIGGLQQLLHGSLSTIWNGSASVIVVDGDGGFSALARNSFRDYAPGIPSERIVLIEPTAKGIGGLLRIFSATFSDTDTLLSRQLFNAAFDLNALIFEALLGVSFVQENRVALRHLVRLLYAVEGASLAYLREFLATGNLSKLGDRAAMTGNLECERFFRSAADDSSFAVFASELNARLSTSLDDARFRELTCFQAGGATLEQHINENRLIVFTPEMLALGTKNCAALCRTFLALVALARVRQQPEASSVGHLNLFAVAPERLAGGPKSDVEFMLNQIECSAKSVMRF